jgi:hypothetical protein
MILPARAQKTRPKREPEARKHFRGEKKFFANRKFSFLTNLAFKIAGFRVAHELEPPISCADSRPIRLPPHEKSSLGEIWQDESHQVEQEQFSFSEKSISLPITAA